MTVPVFIYAYGIAGVHVQCHAINAINTKLIKLQHTMSCKYRTSTIDKLMIGFKWFQIGRGPAVGLGVMWVWR